MGNVAGVLQDLGGFVAVAWHSVLLWIPDAWALALTGSKIERSSAERFEDVVRWMRDTKDRSLIEYGLMSCYAMTLCERRPDDLALLRPATRPLRVELARRLRDAGLAGWPQIVRAVRAEWNADVLQQILFDVVESYGYLFDVILPETFLKKEEETIETLEARVDQLRAELSAAQSAAELASRQSVDEADLGMRVQALENELRLAEEHSRRLEREAIVRAERHAGADSHAAAMERALEEANARNRELEGEVARLRLEPPGERDQTSRRGGRHQTGRLSGVTEVREKRCHFIETAQRDWQRCIRYCSL